MAEKDKNKSRVFSLYLLESLYQKLKKIADKERLSIAWLINEAINEYLKKRKD